MAIKLVAGLGNPGEKYANTRHNIGTWWLLALARQYRLTFKAEAKFHGWIARLPESGVWLLIPATFMNLSGRAVSALSRFHKFAVEEILVVYDELDLPPGTARLKSGGGVSGHNGLKDIVAHLNSPAFWRLRIGIGRPQGDTVNYVLNPPRAEEFDQIEEAIGKGLDVWPLIEHGDFEKAMLKLHTKSKDEGERMKDE
ncbi:MAG: aminoacyl-tRNA hydrolase [Burkholderiales bacterium]